MSLKGFHIVFITISTLLCVGFGVWGVRIYQVETNVPALAMAILSDIGALCLIVYGVKFFKKLVSL